MSLVVEPNVPFVESRAFVRKTVLAGVVTKQELKKSRNVILPAEYHVSISISYAVVASTAKAVRDTLFHLCRKCPTETFCLKYW